LTGSLSGGGGIPPPPPLLPTYSRSSIVAIARCQEVVDDEISNINAQPNCEN